MPFITIYLHNESFLPSNTATHEAALNAAVHAANRLCETINEAFGFHNLAVVTGVLASHHPFSSFPHIFGYYVNHFFMESIVYREHANMCDGCQLPRTC
jgi:hypothetical protein